MLIELQYRLQPRVEAMVRLRYASILFEETDNLNEAEDALNKAVGGFLQPWKCCANCGSRYYWPEG